jgi:hypothetical protein
MNAGTAPMDGLDGELGRLWAAHRAEIDTRLMTTETKTDVAGLTELLAVLRAALAARAS